MTLTTDQSAPAGRVTARTLGTLLEEHLRERYTAADRAELKERFNSDHLVPLRGFLSPELLDAFRAEAFGIMDGHGVQRDLVLEITDGTPRHMRTVGQPVIKEHGPLIDAFYFSAATKDFMSEVVGEEVFTCPYAGEHYVISRLDRSGDTHGWHWDDYTYGFILVLEAPDYRDGGFVQGVPHTSWDKENPDVYGALLNSRVHSYHMAAGDAYIVKTDTTMHRVHPIRGEARRTIVNMTWVSAEDLTVARTHETNDILFGGAGADPVSEK
ncbi:HalD/BesD family halogenase [Streptomyces termitum]|uniref:HalD/BesD family halogenase n=1 Tax=Streptomyces termitum TaxID=67368 RepID=UPI0033A8C798